MPRIPEYIKALDKIYMPYLVNGKLISNAPKEAIKAFDILESRLWKKHCKTFPKNIGAK